MTDCHPITHVGSGHNLARYTLNAWPMALAALGCQDFVVGYPLGRLHFFRLEESG
jgi:hypothetical protein